ncbi:hypothetical protein GCM10023220_35520 [Streptomyces ziwulingensis]|uniref:Uncharacterized protein n=1 Tax=Streptomyces ziwulingensis TaxID=1045501 RepID=A0ABP9C5B4_9ACTN
MAGRHRRTPRLTTTLAAPDHEVRAGRTGESDAGGIESYAADQVYWVKVRCGPRKAAGTGKSTGRGCARRSSLTGASRTRRTADCRFWRAVRASECRAAASVSNRASLPSTRRGWDVRENLQRLAAYAAGIEVFSRRSRG